MLKIILRRGLPLFIIFILIGVNIITLNASSRDSKIFDFHHVLNVSWGNETKEPIMPRSELREINLEIFHTITRGSFGRILLRLMTGKPITIILEINEAPEWCTANIKTGTLSLTVQPDTVQKLYSQLSIQLDEFAPAFGLGYVKIKVRAEKTGIIDAYEREFTLSFIPDYKPLIKPNLNIPDPTNVSIPARETTTISIDIENLGNGRTVALCNVLDLPENWNITILPQQTIPVRETKQVNITVIPDENFQKETINFTFTPVFADDFSKIGQTIYEKITFVNDGTLLKENETPGFEFLIFIIAIGIIILQITRRKYRKE